MKTGRQIFEKYKLLFNLSDKILSILPKKLLIALFGIFRNVKGKKGLFIRYIILNQIVESCGENVSIHENVYLFYPERISLGNNISIHPMSYIDGEGGLIIKDNVSIAHATTILSSNHKYDDLEIPIKYQGMSLETTTIDSNVWVGCKVTILSGAQISSGTVIASNAVVTKSINENSIVAGVPAKVIGVRGVK